MPLSEKAALSKDKATSTYGVKLQHRHFAYIAAVIARMPSSDARLEAATTFANTLHRSNSNFDLARFYRAAGIKVIEE